MNIEELRQVGRNGIELITIPADLKSALSCIDEIHGERIKRKQFSGEELVSQLRIADHCYTLERYHSMEEQKYTIAVNHLIGEGSKITQAERLADEAFPLASILRRRIRAVKVLVEVIRSELSFVKLHHSVEREL